MLRLVKGFMLFDETKILNQCKAYNQERFQKIIDDERLYKMQEENYDESKSLGWNK